MTDEAAAAVAEPIAETVQHLKEKEQERKKPKKQPPYHVVLWNDEEHTYEYVVAMLMQLFGHTKEKGYLMAVEVDMRGRAIVLTTTREHAELKRDQIHAFGKDDYIENCKGSMSATIEPAE
jgi:ATP-dependent Clp protease adaptor protein ClpS